MGYFRKFSDHSQLSTDKWALYLDTYSHIFSENEGKCVSLLEIGVQNGGSLQIYSDFFSPASLIVGCDIDPRVSLLNFGRENIRTVIGSACDDETRDKILEIETKFDYIIDDGSHAANEIIEAFKMYFPMLEFGGTYVAEDLHCSYEYGYGGGLLYRRSSFEFFKTLIDVLNREHWPVGWPTKNFNSKFRKNFGFSADSDFLREIHSIEFKNSMVIIKKKPRSENQLGVRVSSGKIADITVSNVEFSGMTRSEFVKNRTSPLLLIKRSLKNFVLRLH
jgi:hypothetical protein